MAERHRPAVPLPLPLLHLVRALLRAVPPDRWGHHAHLGTRLSRHLFPPSAGAVAWLWSTAQLAVEALSLLPRLACRRREEKEKVDRRGTGRLNEIDQNSEEEERLQRRGHPNRVKLLKRAHKEPRGKKTLEGGGEPAHRGEERLGCEAKRGPMEAGERQESLPAVVQGMMVGLARFAIAIFFGDSSFPTGQSPTLER